LLDLVLTSEYITHGKPDPEGYILAAKKLQVALQEYRVLENSVNSVWGSKGSRHERYYQCYSFFKCALHSEKIIENTSIVHEPKKQAETVQGLISEYNRMAQGD